MTNTDLTAKIDEIITSHNPTLGFKDGERVLYFYDKEKMMAAPQDWEFVKANKPAILARMDQVAAEEKAALISFTVCGWEAHTVVIDTRKGLEEEIASWAEYLSHDAINADTIRKAYEKHLADKAAAEAKEAAEAARIAEIKATAKATGERQILHSYMDDCKDAREECSTDYVTIYAMPDGTTKTERQHTW